MQRMLSQNTNAQAFLPQSCTRWLCAVAFNQEKSLYIDPTQPLGKFLPQLHSIVEGEVSGLRDASGALMPSCIIMEKGEALDVWIESSGDAIDLFAGLQVRSVV